MNVQELADREAIRTVLVRYCLLVDESDVEGLVTEVFAEDARDNHGLGDWVGRDGLREGFSWVLGNFSATMHQVSTVHIELSGNEAVSRCYVTGHHWLPRDAPPRPDGPPPDFTVIGAYDDHLRKDPEGWRIVNRVFRSVGYSVLAQGALPDFMIPTRGAGQR